MAGLGLMELAFVYAFWFLQRRPIGACRKSRSTLARLQGTDYYTQTESADIFCDSIESRAATLLHSHLAYIFTEHQSLYCYRHTLPASLVGHSQSSGCQFCGYARHELALVRPNNKLHLCQLQHCCHPTPAAQSSFPSTIVLAQT